MAIKFDKSYTSPSEIVSILQERGLVIDNHEQAIQYLTHIGYYRFSAYLYPFLLQPKEEHRFKTGSRFTSAGRSSPSFSDAGDESGFFIFNSEGTTTYQYQQLFVFNFK